MCTGAVHIPKASRTPGSKYGAWIAWTPNSSLYSSIGNVSRSVMVFLRAQGDTRTIPSKLLQRQYSSSTPCSGRRIGDEEKPHDLTREVQLLAMGRPLLLTCFGSYEAASGSGCERCCFYAVVYVLYLFYNALKITYCMLYNYIVIVYFHFISYLARS